MADELPDDTETLKAIIRQKDTSIQMLKQTVGELERQREILLGVGSFPDGVEDIYTEEEEGE